MCDKSVVEFLHKIIFDHFLPQTSPDTGEMSEEFDLRLMASFEAEMKRQMAAQNQAVSSDPKAGSARANVLSLQSPPPFENVFGRWKRASTPADASSDDAESSIRGASAPDGVGDIAEIKTEPEDGKDGGVFVVCVGHCRMTSFVGEKISRQLKS